MQPEIRELTNDDKDANHRLGAEAFGYAPDRSPADLPPKGGYVLGAIVDGDPVAKIRLHDYVMHLPGGRQLPVTGVASVAVQPEVRGQGLLTPLFRAGLERMQRDGRPISFLFPTAAGIYRRFGYELAGALEERELAVADLAKVRAAQGISLGRATVDDLDTIRRLYAEWAAERLGPLTRNGPAEPMFSADYVADPEAVTLATDDTGRVVGSVRWTRGTGYDPATSVIDVDDLIGMTPDATRALWRFLGTFSSVSGRIRVELPAGDDALTALATEPPPAVSEHRCMLALLDIPAALSARHGLAGLSAHLPFTVYGGFAAHVDGAYALDSEGGELHCAPTLFDEDGPTFHARGLAALYAGARRCIDLRAAGLLHGPEQYDALWDALFNVPLQIRDYF